MAVALFTNNGSSLLSVAAAADATTITVGSGNGAMFPSPSDGEWFPLTLTTSPGTFEIARCTARSADVLTIVRGQEGTTALALPVGTRIDHRLTAAALNELLPAAANIRDETAGLKDDVLGLKEDVADLKDDTTAIKDETETARNLAQEWAENPEDDQITGTPGSYSALHHAAKASADRMLSEAAKTLAETAAGQAFIKANIKVDIADGIGTTSVGDQFGVIEGTRVAVYEHAAGGVANYLTSFPTADDPKVGRVLAASDDYEVAFRSKNGKILGGLDSNHRFKGAGDILRVSRCLDPNSSGITIVGPDRKIIYRASRPDRPSWAAALIDGEVHAISEDLGLVVPVSWQTTGTKIVGGVDNEKRKLTYAVDTGSSVIPFAEWMDFIAAIPPGTTKIHFVPFIGQSTDMGDKATPVLSAPASGTSRALTFNGGPRVINAYATIAYVNTRLPEDELRYLVPIFEDEDSAAGETPCSGFAKYLADKLPSDEVVVCATVAVGAATYAQIKKGTVPWDNMLRLCRRLAFMTACLGVEFPSLTFDVPGVVTDHGQSNSSTAAATYQGYLEELVADLQADIQPITGQASGPVLVTSQYTSWGKFGVTQSGPALAMLQAALDNPSDIVCAGAEYHIDHDSDHIHFSNVGSLKVGERNAKALAAVMLAGTKPMIYPTAAVLSGDVADIEFNVPVEPLVIDTSTLTDPGNYGIEFVDNGDGNSPTMTIGLKPGSTTALRVTFSEAPTGTGRKFLFARTATLGVGSDINVGPRTNIRDSATDVSLYDASAQHNWCYVSEIAVTT